MKYVRKIELLKRALSVSVELTNGNIKREYQQLLNECKKALREEIGVKL